jgi:putative intracellular protease/amidase
MAHVLVVVAQHFNGHELWTSLGVIQRAGHTFEVVSTDVHISDEVTGKRALIKRTLKDVPSLEGFDALMFVSGNMADTELYWSLKGPLSYVREALSKDLPIAAICCSVPTIREAAKGKRVSFFPLIRSRKLLVDAGAIPSSVSLSVDGKLVTAEHQMMSQMWAEAFAEVLSGRNPTITLVDSKYTPRGNERKPIPGVEYLKDVIRNTGKRGIK